MKLGKKRIVHALLSDKKTVVIVTSPTMEQFAAYLDSFSVISKFGEAFSQVFDKTHGGVVNFGAAKLEQKMLDEFYPLVSALSKVTTVDEVGENLENLTKEMLANMPALSLEDFKELDPLDGLPIIFCYVQLLAPETIVPANPTPAEATTVELPQTVMS